MRRAKYLQCQMTRSFSYHDCHTIRFFAKSKGYRSVRSFLAMQAQAASERGSQADVVHAAEELQVCASVTRAVKCFCMSLKHRMQVNALPACSAFGLQCSWIDRHAL